MKNKLRSLCTLLLLAALVHQVSTAHAQGTAFTYQGQLNSGANAANGTYNLTFALYNVSTGGSAISTPVTNNGVSVSNGLFTVLIDFGASAFTGQTNWLQIGVETNGAGSFTTLTPRQQLMPTPYAIYAEGANATGLSGTIPLAQLPGAVVTTNEASVTLGSLTVSNETNNGSLNLESGIMYSGDSTLMISEEFNNLFVGLGAGNFGTAFHGIGNMGFGNGALASVTVYEVSFTVFDAIYNTAEGASALGADTVGQYNVANGAFALRDNTNGSDNTAEGAEALGALVSGNNNIALGYNAAINFTNSESGNIDIGNAGVAGENNIIRIGTPGNQTQTYLSGTVNCSILAITGGSDLAEPFEVSSPSRDIPQGSVVVIDEQNPGRLKVSSQPYDTRVAGVLSGANGIHPGIQMQQQGLVDGGKNVALSGRVYVQADASNGSIKPGDLLTTSAAPGRAMKVTDHAKAQGAILGKAMTSLSEGQGMVLVLVTLQ